MSTCGNGDDRRVRMTGMRLGMYSDREGALHLVESDASGRATYWHRYGSDRRSADADMGAWRSGSGCEGWGGNQLRMHDPSEVGEMDLLEIAEG